MLPDFLKLLPRVLPACIADGVRGGLVYGSGMDAELWLNVGILAVRGAASCFLPAPCCSAA